MLEELVSLEDEQKVDRIVEEASGRKIFHNFRFLSYHLQKKPLWLFCSDSEWSFFKSHGAGDSNFILIEHQVDIILKTVNMSG